MLASVRLPFPSSDLTAKPHCRISCLRLHRHLCIRAQLSLLGGPELNGVETARALPFPTDLALLAHALRVTSTPPRNASHLSCPTTYAINHLRLAESATNLSCGEARYFQWGALKARALLLYWHIAKAYQAPQT